MNAFFGIGIVSGLVYGIIVDGTYWKIFFAIMLFYIVVFNNLLVDKSHVTTRKNINVTSWGAPTDPTAYLVEEYDVSKALPYIKKLNEMQSEHKITMTHLFSKGLAVAASKMRRDIGRIKWGYFQKAEKLGLSILVDVEGGKDLVPVTLWDAQNDSVIDIAKQTNDIVNKTKKNQNKEHSEVTKIFNVLPTFVLGMLTTVCSYLAQNAGISVKILNVR